MNKKIPQKGKFSTKIKTSKTTTTTAATMSNSTTEPKIKTEPVSLIESGDTSNEDEGDDGENITEVDSGESSSTASTDSDREELLDLEYLLEKDTSKKSSRNSIEEVVIGKEEKALIPAEVQKKKYKALIDTRASRSCMSEKSYHELQLPPLSELFSIRVTSATGTPIKVMGITKCPVTLGNEQYNHTFMVCKNIRRSMILGIDFVRKYRIVTNWTREGQFQIQTTSMETVEAIKVYHKGPTVRITQKMKIPSRTLVLLQGSIKLKKYHQHKFYELNPNPEIEREYSHLVMYPILHQANICGHMKVPICIINFGDEDVHLYPDRRLGILQEEKIKLKDTLTNTSYESIYEVDDGEETGFFSELAYDDKITERKVITSPADIHPRVKPKLKDADITPE